MINMIMYIYMYFSKVIFNKKKIHIGVKLLNK